MSDYTSETDVDCTDDSLSFGLNTNDDDLDIEERPFSEEEDSGTPSSSSSSIQTNCPKCNHVYDKGNHKPMFSKLCNHTHCSACWVNKRVSSKKPGMSTQYACPECNQRMTKSKNKLILTLNTTIFDYISTHRPTVINDDEEEDIGASNPATSTSSPLPPSQRLPRPIAPAPPKTAYNFFCEAKFPKMQGIFSLFERNIAIGKLWKKTTSTGRYPYEEQARNSKVDYANQVTRYNTLMAAYREENNISDQGTLPQVRKQALNNYMIYTIHQRPKLQREKHASSNEIARALGIRWHSMTPQEKKPYTTLAETNKARLHKGQAYFTNEEITKILDNYPTHDDDDDDEETSNVRHSSLSPPSNSSSPSSLSSDDDDDNEIDSSISTPSEVEEFFSECCEESDDIVKACDIQSVRKLWMKTQNKTLSSQILENYLREKLLLVSHSEDTIDVRYKLKIKSHWKTLLDHSPSSPRTFNFFEKNRSAYDFFQLDNMEYQLMDDPSILRDRWNALSLEERNVYIEKARLAEEHKNTHDDDDLDENEDNAFYFPSSSLVSTPPLSLHLSSENEEEEEEDNSIKCEHNQCHNRIAVASCISCYQNYCEPCWEAIHNCPARIYHERTRPYVLSPRFCTMHDKMMITEMCIDDTCPLADKFLCRLCERCPPHEGHKCESIVSIYARNRRELESHAQLTNSISQRIHDIRENVLREQVHVEKRHHCDIETLVKAEETLVKKLRAQFSGARDSVDAQYATRQSKFDATMTQTNATIDDIESKASLIENLRNTVDPFIMVESIEKYRASRDSTQSSLSSHEEFLNYHEKKPAFDTHIMSGHVFKIQNFTSRKDPIVSSVWNLQEDLNLRLTYIPNRKDATDNKLCFQLSAEHTNLVKDYAIQVQGIIQIYNTDYAKSNTSVSFCAIFNDCHQCMLFNYDDILTIISNPVNGFIVENDTVILSLYAYNVTKTISRSRHSPSHTSSK
mgnify:CR=1 FL=1